MGEGWIYSSEPDARWIERDPAALLPLWRDVQWARAGAYQISPRFGAYFDRTTYLGDGARCPWYRAVTSVAATTRSRVHQLRQRRPRYREAAL